MDFRKKEARQSALNKQVKVFKYKISGIKMLDGDDDSLKVEDLL